ncbi:hypothetical protein BCON_0045g00400 [Botryotinia convoluta]|uniref:Uncharacterized protein n=1 Tax=Botryotinia convoluta TaxID=54673 RepID=A0A4Z1ICL7_9HELO|nr:hypothetical protein BCON_0045g00400 [Botryotinia convoluta]
MELSTKYEWGGTKSIEESSDAELFVVMCEESPTLKRIVFLGVNVVFCVDAFPNPQLSIEVCLKATGCPCEVERRELLGKFNSGNEESFALKISRRLSACGLNLKFQHNHSGEIISGTSFSNLHEGQALARIYRIGQTRSIVPDLVAHMAREDDIVEAEAEYLAEISNLDGANSAKNI